MKSAARLSGVFAEPAAAAAVAGVKRAVAEGVIERHQDVLAVVTGSGLKDIKTAIEISGEPIDVEPPSESRDTQAARDGGSTEVRDHHGQ